MKKLLLLFALPLILFSCDIYDNPEDESFLFIEIVTNNSSSVVNDDSVCVSLCVDGPLYSFDQSTQKLDIYNPLEIDPATRYLLGVGTFLSKDIGCGGSNSVRSITLNEYKDSLYWSLSDKKDNINIKIISEYGVEVSINDSLSFILYPSEAEFIENKYFGRYNNETCLHEVTRSVAFINHGKILKSNIRYQPF